MKTKEKKREPLKVRGKGVLNQKAQVFEDRRTKRSRTRGAQERQALRDGDA